MKTCHQHCPLEWSACRPAAHSTFLMQLRSPMEQENAFLACSLGSCPGGVLSACAAHARASVPTALHTEPSAGPWCQVACLQAHGSWPRAGCARPLSTARSHVVLVTDPRTSPVISEKPSSGWAWRPCLPGRTCSACSSLLEALSCSRLTPGVWESPASALLCGKHRSWELALNSAPAGSASPSKAGIPSGLTAPAVAPLAAESSTGPGVSKEPHLAEEAQPRGGLAEAGRREGLSTLLCEIVRLLKGL